MALAPASSVWAQQRAVAVVYDDSGSMEGGDRWWFANYALQVLTALLEEGDSLHVVRMSSPERADRLVLSDRQRILERMQREGIPRASTPFQAIATAMEALQRSDAAERWLVVITDGDINQVPDLGVLRTAVRAFVAETGTRTLFLLIGQDRNELTRLASQPAVATWVREAQAKVYRAGNQQEIIDRMQEIAAEITGRAAGAGPTVTFRGDTVLVHSEFPLRRLTIFEQDPASSRGLAQLRSGRAAGDALGARPLDVQMPNASRVSLYGRITDVTHPGRDRVIPEGEVTLVLDRAAMSSRLSVLPQVAALLTVSVTDSAGQQVPVSAGVLEPCVGTPFLIRAALIAPNGDTIARQSQLTQQIAMRASYRGTETPMRQAAGAYYETELRTGHDTTTVSVSAAYPGYFNLKSRVLTVGGVDCGPPRTLGVEAYEPWSALVTELGGRGALAALYNGTARLMGIRALRPASGPFHLLPLVDGQRPDSSDFANWTLTLINSPDLPMEITRGEGEWMFRPLLRRGLPHLTPPGRIQVEVELTTPRRMDQASRHQLVFDVHPVPWWVLWLPVALLVALTAFLLWYLRGIAVKPRFCRDAAIVFSRKRRDDYRQGRGFLEPLPTSWWNRWLVPYRPERKVVRDVLFQATRRCSEIHLPTTSQSAGMYVNGLPVENPPVRAWTIANGQGLVIERRTEDHCYEYTKSGAVEVGS